MEKFLIKNKWVVANTASSEYDSDFFRPPEKKSAGSSDAGTNTSTQLQLTESGSSSSYSISTSSSQHQSTILHPAEDSSTLPQVSVSLDCNQPNNVPDGFTTQKP
ncbi:hypothetical protein PR048_012790 [Dryococelus australis]|uniref:Uncharacterized protein n=1 Tax=Dryococelus australis TaxID=614101 RepID=A0ABQ9HQD1_9NEOP|nr:hypothetical protein PR048_012790 [Dryococelus australis]